MRLWLPQPFTKSLKIKIDLFSLITYHKSFLNSLSIVIFFFFFFQIWVWHIEKKKKKKYSSPLTTIIITFLCLNLAKTNFFYNNEFFISFILPALVCLYGELCSTHSSKPLLQQESTPGAKLEIYEFPSIHKLFSIPGVVKAPETRLNCWRDSHSRSPKSQNFSHFWRWIDVDTAPPSPPSAINDRTITTVTRFKAFFHLLENQAHLRYVRIGLSLVGIMAQVTNYWKISVLLYVLLFTEFLLTSMKNKYLSLNFCFAFCLNNKLRLDHVLFSF